MDRILSFFAIVLLAGVLASCGVPPAPDPAVPGPEVRRMARMRACAVLVTKRTDFRGWGRGGLSENRGPGDSDGGSAVPISEDGYFLTADHVLASMEGRNVFVLHGLGKSVSFSPARVVWRSKAADLALLKIDAKIADYYEWSPSDQWLPVGTPVIHGGVSTGESSPAGKLVTAVAPESGIGTYRKFKLDIPFEPGDSGGPVVDARGRLVGINSAVEYLVPIETAFFVDSEANRPNLRFLERIIRNDRLRKNQSAVTVD